jgi:hypothetical protein
MKPLGSLSQEIPFKPFAAPIQSRHETAEVLKTFAEILLPIQSFDERGFP